MGCSLGDVLEKQSVLRHGVVDAAIRPGSPVAASESREHDGNRHQRAAYRAEHLSHHRGADAVLGGVLDAARLEWWLPPGCHPAEGIQINEIAGHVKRDHYTRAKASESGRLRLGFFTSPAVKVTLFQASAENSDPTCATARTVNAPTNTLGPPTPPEPRAGPKGQHCARSCR